jgi:hypothetical protein
MESDAAMAKMHRQLDSAGDIRVHIHIAPVAVTIVNLLFIRPWSLP